MAAAGEGRVLGTPDYMSPEQARGRPVDKRGDVFAIGVILYEVATGKRPFKAGTTMELLMAIDRDPHVQARAVNPRVPAALERIIDRCLAKSPADRYADAGELAAELDRFLSQPPTVYRTPLRGAIIAAIGIGAVGVAAILAFSRPSTKPITTAPPAVSAMPKATDPAIVATAAPSAAVASAAPPSSPASASATPSASAPQPVTTAGVATAHVKRGGPAPAPTPSSTPRARPDPLADQL